MKASIRHIAYALPDHLLTNEMLAEEQPDWNFEKLVPKTGVRARHIAAADESASDLAFQAAEKLIEASGIDRADIDALILCTQTPDQALPTTACSLQHRLGLSTGTAAFDINQGCSGYIYSLAIGSSMIEAGTASRILLLCAETYSKFIAPDNRTARTVFGDGAAATLLEGSDENIGSFLLGTDGSGKDKLCMEQGALHIDGPGVFMFTMNRVPECVEGVLEKAGCTREDMDLFVFHQASRVVMNKLIDLLELDPEKVYFDIDQIGNTVSASIPIALKKAMQEKRLRKGMRIMLIGFGVGLSWGGCIMEWQTDE